MRIGIFGGSFDPIHQGHLILAENCREQAALDLVLFIPSAVGPHKTDGANSSDRQRCEMIELAIAGHESFRLSKLEIERGGISYTADTLSGTQKSSMLRTNCSCCWATILWRVLTAGMSRRKFASFQSQWLLIAPVPERSICRCSKSMLSADRYQQISKVSVDSPMIEISSSDIRSRVSEEKSIRYLMPRGVERYIGSHSVYAAKAGK